MQKAQKNIDVQRFRRYLGRNYMDTDRADEGNKGLPIILIYFLGFNLTIKRPVLKINREYQDVSTGETLIGASDPFIESLTHDAFIVQIGALASETQTELEKVLSVFNQKWVLQKEPNGLSWLLKYPAHQQHPLLDRIIDRLALATESEEVQQDILAEEEFFNSLDAYHRQKDEEIAEERKQKEEAQKREEEPQKREEEAQKREEEERQQKEEAQKREKEAQKMLAITVKLLHQNMSVAQIAAMLKKPEAEITVLLDKQADA